MDINLPLGLTDGKMGQVARFANVFTPYLFDNGANIRKFLENVDNYGLLTKNNFEISFSGLDAFTFYAQNLTLPDINCLTVDVNYDGRVIKHPYNIEYGNTFTITLLCDAKGYIYTFFKTIVLNERFRKKINTGRTITVKAISPDQKYNGLIVTFRGVRIVKLGGLNFGQNSNDIQMFDINCSCIDFTITQGEEQSAVSGFIDDVNDILGGLPI